MPALTVQRALEADDDTPTFGAQMTIAMIVFALVLMIAGAVVWLRRGPGARS
jgi:hypothetical protein